MLPPRGNRRVTTARCRAVMNPRALPRARPGRGQYARGLCQSYGLVPLWFGSVALSSRRRAHGFGLKCLADHLLAAAGQPGWAVHRARQLHVDCLDTMLKAVAGQFLPGNWPGTPVLPG
jgi:hypothetical protein